MKMAAIKKVVMDAKKCIIAVDKEGEQWIGDGKRFYAVDEDIRFNEDNVLTILDVDKERRSKIDVETRKSMDPRYNIYFDQQDGENLRLCMAIMYGGELILIFMTDESEVFAIRHADLKPVELGRDYKLLRLEVDEEEVKPVIAVALDVFTAAILTPLSTRVVNAIIAECGMIAGGVTKGYFDEDDGQTE